MRLSIAALLVLSLITITPAADKADIAKSTLENLQAAFNGESNASAKYTAFAKKAEEQGLGHAASLFRAAAQAEKIHAASHAKVIEAMGAKAVCDIKLPDINDTSENLKAAIAGESYERDTMYPAFIIKAKADKNDRAIQTFDYALAAETLHAKLYSEALALAARGKSAAVTYFVCPKCGHTANSIDGKCPECGCKADQFLCIK